MTHIDAYLGIALAFGAATLKPRFARLWPNQTTFITLPSETATRCVCGALILESGFSSASSLGARALPWLPRWLHFLARNRFESARKLQEVNSPVLITHGDPDLTIPTDEGRALFAAANEPKKLLI